MNGVAINKELKQFELTLFVNKRKLDANLETINDEVVIKSFRVSGLHQTLNDIGNQNNVGYASYGASLKYSRKN